ncbi:MAG: ABC transporter permease [Anaerolineae bacterium]|nr:ABC transporter permease [Anaerolineae bacterium]
MSSLSVSGELPLSMRENTWQKNPVSQFLRRLWQAPLVAVALLVLITVVGLAISAPWLAPHDPTLINVVNRLKPPVWIERGVPEHLLGTDSLGRDVLSRVIYGSRVSMVVGFTVVVISGTLGMMIGLVAGYMGGWIDDVIMRLADITLAFPFLLLAIAFLAVLGPGLLNVIIVLAVWGWVPYARVVRGQTLALREREFIDAVRAIGAQSPRIIFHHILPNTWAATIVIATLAVANTILAEAALSFLGLGVKPAVPTWGGMLAEGREHITVAWWIVTFPGLAIMLTILCINLFGDWLRDYLDPRLRL